MELHVNTPKLADVSETEMNNAVELTDAELTQNGGSTYISADPYGPGCNAYQN
jgi:hypothetical protein